MSGHLPGYVLFIVLSPLTLMCFLRDSLVAENTRPNRNDRNYRLDVIDRWKEARSQLTTAIRAFYDASVALDIDLACAPTSQTDSTYLKANMDALVSELPGVTEDKNDGNHLCKAQKG